MQGVGFSFLAPRAQKVIKMALLGLKIWKN